MTFVKWLPGAAARLGLVMVLAFFPHGALGLTTGAVQGTVYRADGSVASGTLLLSWPAFTTSADEAIAAGSKTVAIGANGWVVVNLAPNAGASPDGTYYTAVFHLNDGTTSTEYWVVPASTVASLASVRATVVPVAKAVQTVSRQYVDNSVAQVTSGFVHSSGGAMSGPLMLSSDPAGVLQAATKQYVDRAASQLLATAGGTMQGSLLLAGDPAVDSQAATKHYVDHASAAGPSGVSKAGDTMTGPLNLPMINGKAYASGTTLQQAIDAAGTTGSVEIPASYAGNDTFTNPNSVPVVDQRVREWRSVTEWGVKCDGVTDNHGALKTAFLSAIDPYNNHGPFGLTFPAGRCYTSQTVPYSCQNIKGVGIGITLLVGGQGYDVLGNIEPNDRTLNGTPGGTGSGLCGWRGITNRGSIRDITLMPDTSVDITRLNTTLTSAIGATDTTLVLGSTQYYRWAGFVLVDQELIHYTVLDGNRITTSNAVDRGYGGTVAVSHAVNAPVHYLGDLAFSGQGSAWAPKPWVSSISHTPAVTIRTWLTTDLNVADTTMVLGNVTGLPPSGLIQIANEFLTYTGLSGNTLSGVVHGVHGTTPSYHSPRGGGAGDTVQYSSYLPALLESPSPAGSTSLTLAYAPIGFPASGTLLIDAERMTYSALSGTTVTTSATVVAHSPKAVVNVVDSLSATQTTIAITDNPSGTPLGYAAFGGFGEVIGAMGIDYGNGSREYVTYTDGEPYVIPESVPTQYFVVYHGVSRGQTSTAAVSHVSTATINAVNPFTFTTPTQNGTNNGVIPAWNIGNCGLAFHHSDPGAVGTLTAIVGNPDLSNFEVLGSSNAAGTSTCGILYQSWPYQTTVKDYNIQNTNYGIMWALSGVNAAGQGSNSAGPSTSPYNKFQNGTITAPMPWWSIAGPQKISDLNMESGSFGNNTPYSESRVPSDGHAIAEDGYIIGSAITLNGVTGEFNLGNSWLVNPFYPMGSLYDNLITDTNTTFGSSGVSARPFYLDTQESNGFSATGNVILTPDSFMNSIYAPTDLGSNNNVITEGVAQSGVRGINYNAQIQTAGQSRPDAFLMGYVSGDWFNSLVDLKIEPEDMMSQSASRGLQGTMVLDSTVPLGRGKAFHLAAPGNNFGVAGASLRDSGILLGSRINYGKGTMYVPIKADSGPTTQNWLMNVTGSNSFMAVTCNLTTSWSVCAVPYDTSVWGIEAIQNAQIVASPTANGFGVTIGPIVFAPDWNSLTVKNLKVTSTAPVANLTLTGESQVPNLTADLALKASLVSPAFIGPLSASISGSGALRFFSIADTVGLSLVDSSHLAMAFSAGYDGTSLSFDDAGYFGIFAESHANIVGNTETGAVPAFYVTKTGDAFTLAGGSLNTGILKANVLTGIAPISVISTTPVVNLTLANPSQVPNLPATQITGLAPVATSGSYASLSDKPVAGTDFVVPGGSITGSASTASSLLAAPAVCATGLAAAGITANGNAMGCAAYAPLAAPSFTSQATAPKFIGVIASEMDIPFSATPIFSSTANLNYMSLTGNVSSSTLTAGASGQSMVFVLCQDITGSRTFVWPANVRGGMTVGASASGCSSQMFSYVSGLGMWVAANAGMINE